MKNSLRAWNFGTRQNDENTQYLMYILCIFVFYLYQQIPLRFFKFLRDIWLRIRHLFDTICLIVRNKCLHVGFVWYLVLSHSELNNHLLSYYSYQIIVSIGNNTIFNAHRKNDSSLEKLFKQATDFWIILHYTYFFYCEDHCLLGVGSRCFMLIVIFLCIQLSLFNTSAQLEMIET